MDKPIINSFSGIAPLIIQQYERYLPTAFDESLSILEKVNKVINYLDTTNKLSNDLITQWNSVMLWVMADGLTDEVNKKLDTMVTDGTLDTIINQNIFDDLNTQILDTKTRTTNLENKFVTTDMFPKLVGETDDSNRIKRAIDYAKSVNKSRVIFNEKDYTILDPIDLTNLSGGFTIEGQGINTTKITGKTRYIMIDCSGSPYAKVKDIHLFADTGVDASTIGIFFARTTANQYVEFSTTDNVRIELGSMPYANTNNGTIGIYNYSAELCRYKDVYIVADRPLCLFGKNKYNLTSPYATIVSGFQSMSEVNIDGASTLTSLNFSALSLDTCTNIKGDNLFMNCWGSPLASNKYAIDTSGSINSFDLTGHIEDFVALMSGIGTQFMGLNLDVSKQINTNGIAQILLDGSAYNGFIKGSSIKVVPMVHPEYVYNLIEQVGNIHGGTLTSEITLYPNQNLKIPYGYATGTRIYCEDDSNILEVPTGGYDDGLVIYQRANTTFRNPLSIPKGFNDFGGKQLKFGGASPTTGTWVVGDRVHNNFPVSGGFSGWVLTPDGWKGYGLIES
jgi:hypothetical protein